MPTVFITGTSSGIGRGTAKAFLEHGWNVAGTQLPCDIAKEEELNRNPNCRLYELDVLDYQKIPKVAAEVIEDFGNVDVVINNAGIGIMGPIEVGEHDQIAKILDVNVIGYIMVIKAFLPYLRKSKKGMIINVGALGGRLVHPGLGFYNLTKAAIGALSEELLMELKPLGIDVKLIEPSGVKSNLGTVGTVALDPDAIADYQFFYKEQLPRTFDVVSGKVLGTDEFYPPLEPEEMGEVIFRAATEGGDTFRFQSGPHAIRMLEERAKLTDQEYIEQYLDYYKAK